MEETQANVERQPEQEERSGFKKIVCNICWFFFHLTWATIRYTTIAVIAILIILGSLSVYEFFVPEKIPFINVLRSHDREKIMAVSNTTRNLSSASDEKLWNSMQTTLQILDKVCPESAEWVRDRHSKGKLVWEREYTGTYATYDYVSQVLTFNKSSFSMCDGIKASILAHEHRHSLQGYSKFYRATLACMICGNPRVNLVESDAYLFEKRIVLAIFLGMGEEGYDDR